MVQPVTVHLESPISSARFCDRNGEGLGDSAAGQPTGASQAAMREAEAQKAAFSQVNQALREAAGRLNEFYETSFSAHKGEIAKLAVEIARKILAQKVENGDYEIQLIVKEALSNAPSRDDVVVHLNPEDLSQYEKLQKEDPAGELTGVKFVGDANIGRAECQLETPKGIIESIIEQHLEEVGRALAKVN